MILTPKNWHTFQHYKHRNPPWVKLHKGLLDDWEFQCLPDASKALAPMLWLLASESSDGSIRMTEEALAFRLRKPFSDLSKAIEPLVSSGFFSLASGVLAGCKQDALLVEKSREETEKKQSAVRGAKRGPAWMSKHDPSVIDATQEIMSFYPDQSKRQPDGKPIPKTSSPELADRLARIKGQGGDLSVCVSIARRYVEESSVPGKWMKAAQNFFGLADDAPFKAYYQAHVTNEGGD